MKRKQAIEFIRTAKTAYLLPDLTVVDTRDVSLVAAIEGTRFMDQEDGSLYVQGARHSYEVWA